MVFSPHYRFENFKALLGDFDTLFLAQFNKILGSRFNFVLFYNPAR
jgi:hypothetical protein